MSLAFITLRPRWWAVVNEYGVVVHLFRRKRRAEHYLLECRAGSTQARLITHEWKVIRWQTSPGAQTRKAADD